MKHKLYSLLLTLCLLASLLASCTQDTPESQTQTESQAASQTEIRTEAHSETQDVIETEAQTEPRTEPEAESQTELETEPDDGRTVVEIICPIADAVTFTGGETVQDVTDQAFVPVFFEIKRGYQYEGYEIDGKLYTGTEIAPENITKDTTVTLKLDYATRELPIVHLNTGDAGINSTEIYTDVTFDLVNTDSEMHGLTGGIRLRGNSTAGYDKKPYRIKFDYKVSLFGLHKAKSWVLLAEYLDPSCMHNYTAYHLGAASDTLNFTPTPHHVNVYLNGDYVGLYTLCEQVQENEGRMDLEQTITEDMTNLADFNFYVCLDENAQFDPNAVKGEDYFYIAWCNKYFSLKYPKKEDFCSEAQFRLFFEQLENHYKNVLDAFREGNTKKIKKYVDTDSLIDHMIIDQIMGERDHVWKSFYTYQIAGQKLAFGPIWDYDYSLYVPWTDQPNEYYTVDSKIEYSNEFFRGVARSDELYDKLCERYQSYYSDVLGDCIKHVRQYKTNIDESLALNDQLWYADKDDITEKNYDFLIKFLQGRKKVLDREWR